MIDLLRSEGFDVEGLVELRPAEDATATYKICNARVGAKVADRRGLEGAPPRRRGLSRRRPRGHTASTWSSSRSRAGPRRDPRIPWVYVGSSARDPELRLAQHKRGYKSSGLVKRHALRLRPDLYEDLEPLRTSKAGRRAPRGAGA